MSEANGSPAFGVGRLSALAVDAAGNAVIGKVSCPLPAGRARTHAGLQRRLAGKPALLPGAQRDDGGADRGDSGGGGSGGIIGDIDPGAGGPGPGPPPVRAGQLLSRPGGDMGSAAGRAGGGAGEYVR